MGCVLSPFVGPCALDGRSFARHLENEICLVHFDFLFNFAFLLLLLVLFFWLFGGFIGLRVVFVEIRTNEE